MRNFADRLGASAAIVTDTTLITACASSNNALLGFTQRAKEVYRLAENYMHVKRYCFAFTLTSITFLLAGIIAFAFSVKVKTHNQLQLSMFELLQTLAIIRNLDCTQV